MRLERQRTSSIENTFLNVRLQVEQKIDEARRSGMSEEQFLDHSSMKRRYLEALHVYRNLGLAPRELCDATRYRVWLWRPGEFNLHPRLKTISMFLRRLVKAGLAHRKKDGREYPYFTTSSGVKRLKYYLGNKQ